MKRIAFLVTLFLVFNSCNRVTDLGIKSLGFDSEVEVLQNLFFEFDRELVFDGDLNQWESTPYLNFEPKIEGKFKWIGKKELVFSPSKPLKFASEYKARLSEKLLKRQKGKFDIDREIEVKFHTPYLKILDSQLFFTKNNQNQKETRVLLSLNGKYDAHNIKEEIALVQNEKPIEYKTIPAENSENLILVIDPNVNLKKGSIVAKISPKPENKAKFKEKVELEITYQNNEKLEILKTETSFKKLKGYIEIKTNQQIDISQIEKNININPKVNYKIEQTDSGFRIQGEFGQDDIYKIKINKSIVGTLGGRLDEDFEVDAYFGRVDPFLEFTNKKAQYISSLGNKNIGVNIVNISKIDFKLSKVYENNLLPFLNANRRSYYNDGQEEFYYSENADLYGDDVIDKKIETENLPKKQGVSMLNMPLPSHRDQKGVYFVTVRSEEDYYRSIQKIISVSDIGLIAKMSQNQEDLLVFVNSIMETKPLSGVEIKLISSNNQEIVKANSDKNGLVIFKGLKSKHSPFKVAMITASNAEDFNYLLFDDTEIETSKFDINGKIANKALTDAFIYGDREIYRPGETIHFNVVLRNNEWKTVENLPIKIKVKQPNGKDISSVMLNSNVSGAVAHSVVLDRAAITGFYQIDVLTGDDVVIGSKSISVEDFMPDRIKVKLEGKDKLKIGETMNLKIQALNLFGPPANDKPYEVDFSIKKKKLLFTGFEGFSFGVEDFTKYENELRTGSTDDKGEAIQNFEISPELKNRGLLEGKMLVSVFDETGRPVHRLKSFEIITQNQFYGIKTPAYFTGTNIPYNFQLAAVNPEGKNVSSKALIEIVLLDYQTVLEKTENGLRYVSKKKEKVIKTEEVNFNGAIINKNFVPRISGEYEIRISESGKEAYVSSNLYAYGYGNKASFEVNTDGEIAIETSKEIYNIGETAKAIFKTPFDGKLLITIESNGILEHKFIETENKSAEISVKLNASHLPNIYFTATLIRPMNQPELPLMSAHGIATIKVEDPDRVIPISVNVPSKVRSQTKQKILIKTKPNTELTVAVVDEGILQLKNTVTPKIYDFFYQKRALGVTSYDLYPLLLPEIPLNLKSSTGGDGSMGKRVNPLANGRAELVSKWSGHLKSDKDGNAQYEFEIPEFLGSLRVMVVAYNGENFGSNEQSITVSDPISISLGIPMFLSPTDKVKVPVSFFNTTNEAQEIKISSLAEGQIKRNDFVEKSLKIEPGAEKQAELEIEAFSKIGLGKLKILAQNKNETFSKTTEIAIRPSGSLRKFGESGILALEKEKVFLLPDNILEGSLSSKIYVSNSPQMQFAHRLEGLLEYPHGCIEQTISKAFPQLYFDELIVNLNGKNEISESGNSQFNPQFNINAAIEKIAAMQHYNGSVSYWPGYVEDYWWGSAYALHFLLEAEKTGFEVPKNVKQSLIYYLTNKTNEEEEKETIWVNLKNVYSKKERIKTELIYSLYVLSLTDEPNVATMNFYKTNINSLSNDQQFLLACAFKQIGDENTFGSLLPKTFNRESFDRMLSGSISSPIRNMALVLNTLVETDPSHSQIANLSASLNTILNNKNNYLNTQELGFSLIAFGKILKNADKNGQVQIFSEGKLIKTIEGKGEWIDLSKYPKGIEMKAKNSNMYYVWESEGILKNNQFLSEDKSLKVRKSYYTRTGELIKTPNFKQNQLVVVKLTVSTLAGLAYKVDNVVLTDMLPAGFEIENPRLVEDREINWLKNASTANYFDIRDDRIHYFVDVSNEEKNYYYLARAVTRGTFIQGQVSADAMYNGSLRSYWGGGTVVIN